MKILLLEDEQNFVDLLLILLAQIDRHHVLPTKTANECLTTFAQQAHDIELCLLDIHLGTAQHTGIEAARGIRKMDKNIPIIFITSMYNEKYYAQTKDIRPSAFLNKNLDRVMLRQAIELGSQHALADATTPASSGKEKRIFLKVGDRYKAVDLNKVSYFSAESKMVYCHIGERKYPIRASLKDIRTKLNSNFLRVHRSYIINTEMLETVNLVEDIIDINNVRVPIGAAYKKELLDSAIWLK